MILSTMEQKVSLMEVLTVTLAFPQQNPGTFIIIIIIFNLKKKKFKCK